MPISFSNWIATAYGLAMTAYYDRDVITGVFASDSEAIQSQSMVQHQIATASGLPMTAYYDRDVITGVFASRHSRRGNSAPTESRVWIASLCSQ